MGYHEYPQLDRCTITFQHGGIAIPIDREEVRREARETGRIIRERLLGIPNRVAPIILGELGVDDIHFQQKIFTILTKEIHEALEALQEYPSMLAKLFVGTAEEGSSSGGGR